MIDFKDEEGLNLVVGKIVGRFILSGFDINGTLEFTYKLCKKELGIDLKDGEGKWVGVDVIITKMLEAVSEILSEMGDSVFLDESDESDETDLSIFHFHKTDDGGMVS